MRYLNYVNAKVSFQMDLGQLVSSELFEQKTHNDLIDTLRAHKSDKFDELYKARLNKAQYFALDQDEVNDILEDLVAIKEEDKRYQLLDNFYEFLVKEYPTVYYWIQYLDFAILHKNKEDFQEIIIGALNDTVYDFDGSHKIWERVLRFFGDLFQETDDPKDLERLWMLYLKRISIPHRYLQDSYNQTSQFVTSHFAEDYNEYMGLALKVFHKTESKMIYYEKYELKLSEQFQMPSFWSNYIKDVARYSTDIKQFSSIFYRSLLAADENWMSVWISYIYNLYSKENNEVYLLDVLGKFVKAFPGYSLSYAEAVRNSHLFEKAVYYNTILSRLDYLDLMKNNDYNDWKVLALAMLKYEPSDKLVEKYFRFALKNNDTFHTVEKVCIAIYEQQNRIKDADKRLKEFCREFPTEFEVWSYSLEFYKRNRYDYNLISKVFKDALKYAFDMNSPDKLIQEQLEYEQVYGDRVSHTTALIKADDIMRQIIEQSLYQEELPEEIEVKEQNTKKRKLEDNDSPDLNKKAKAHVEPVRNREELSVKVTNLPSDIKELILEQFFSDCGEIKDIIIYLVEDRFEAVIEFAFKQSILTALTKSHKKIGNEEIIVKQLHNSIIWVTNFPPHMNEKGLKSLFSEVGNVISVRFPTQKSNKVRRFCYIEFSESELTNAAILKLNGKVLSEDGKDYKLVVKHSDNLAPKKSPLFKREVYISNLDFKVTKEQVSTFFSQFGKVEDVVMPLKENMRSKGYSNGGFGFVVFQSEPAAVQALAKNGCKFEGRTINIQPSKASKPENINTFDKATSIVVTGFEPTTTKDQIQHFLSKQLAQPYAKMLHLPEKLSIVLQFDSVDNSGKASLHLSTLKFYGSDLKVSSINEFTNPSTTQKRPALFVPMSVIRR